jgi:hypothetical protein
MRQGSASTPENELFTPGNETQAPIAMPPDVREAVVDLLAQILVLDYQLFQGVTRPTVVEGSVCNRRLRGRMANAASGSPSAHEDIRRSPFMQ